MLRGGAAKAPSAILKRFSFKAVGPGNGAGANWRAKAGQGERGPAAVRRVNSKPRITGAYETKEEE